jgi:regulator of cell morphogenesis and NO signaling
MKNKSLEHLVNENIAYANVLERFGVKFIESREKTLSEVCKEHGFDERRLVEILEKSDNRRAPEYLDLRNYPVRLIVEYLKHAHQGFIKDTLPFILRKVDELENEVSDSLVSDLKVVLPMFVEDFIHHIYEEEDRLFTYVAELEKVTSKQKYSPRLLKKFDQFSIQEFALHHNDSDHEMKGIRGITNNYQVADLDNPHLVLLLKALKRFDEELTVHANIENDILFPRALMLEKKANQLINKNVALN